MPRESGRLKTETLSLKLSYIAENTEEVPVARGVGLKSLPKTIRKDLVFSTNRRKGVRKVNRKYSF